MNGISIKDWRFEDRPREKMLARGAAALTDAELLAILLRTGSYSKSALDIARELLEDAGNSLGNISVYSLDKLTLVKGIGRAKALTLLAAFETGRRSLMRSKDSEKVITNAADVVDFMLPVMAQLDHEECWTIFLNRSNRVIGRERLSSGGISSTVIDVKMVVRRAVEKLASNIIIVHNHPGGDPRPGEYDKKNTAALKKAAAALDINLLDHVVVAGKRYYSFSEEEYRMR